MPWNKAKLRNHDDLLLNPGMDVKLEGVKSFSVIKGQCVIRVELDETVVEPLKAARTEVLEEAASIAEGYTEAEKSIGHAIAAAIRALDKS